MMYVFFLNYMAQRRNSQRTHTHLCKHTSIEMGEDNQGKTI